MTQGRTVEMFRCHVDPMIGPTPKNAFVPKDLNMEAHLIPSVGVYVKVLKTGAEHIVPFANVQSVRLAKETEKTAKKKTDGQS